MKKALYAALVVTVAVVGVAGRSISKPKPTYVYEIGPVSLLGEWSIGIFNPTGQVRMAKVEAWNELGASIPISSPTVPLAAHGTSFRSGTCDPTACQRNFIVTVPSKAMIPRLRFDNLHTSATDDREAGEWHFYKK